MPVPCSQTLQMKQQVASAFLDKFQLKLEEIKILRGPRDGALHEVGRLGTGVEVGGGGGHRMCRQVSAEAGGDRDPAWPTRWCSS